VSVVIPSLRAAFAVSGWAKNELWRKARAVPSIDLRFADSKSTVDAYTGRNLVTHTRASSGTYVGSDGVLRTAVTNLCLQSEDITTTWTNFQSTDVANTAIAPNGTLTADTLIVNNAASGGLVQQSFTLPDSNAYAFSVYAKAAGNTSVTIQFYNKANTFYGSKVLNLNTGALTGSDFNGTSSVVSVGDGWYRFLYTGLSSGTGANTPNIRVVDPSTGNGTSGIHLWGAQLEQSSTVGEYVPTTSVINSAPRFDHNPQTGESLGLLVEEARTNVLTWSEDFSNAAWTSVAATPLSNTATAPDGALTADSYTATAVSGEHRILRASNVTVTASSTITFSVFVKASGITRLRLNIYDNPGRVKEIVANVNLSTGTIALPTAGGGYTAVASSIQPYPNSFYRISITGTVDAATTSVLCDLSLQNSAGNLTWTPVGTETLIVWGAQLEAGAFPTSYIPTTSATATRAADVASITGSNFSSWYNQTEGTVYAEFAPAFQGSASVAASNPGVWGVTQNSLGPFNGYGMRLVSNSPFNDSINAISRYAPSAFNNQVSIGPTAYLNAGQNYRTMFAWEPSGIAGSSQGQTVTTNTNPAATAMGTHDQFYLGRQNVGGTPTQLNGTIKRLVYWGQRLPNNVLQAITQ
jgi:hypothetical protein